MNQTDNKIKALKIKQKQLSERIKRLEAAEKTKERKRETRRKILVGAFYLDQARESGQLQELVQKMDNYLNRPSDRELFGLETKTTNKQSSDN